MSSHLAFRYIQFVLMFSIFAAVSASLAATATPSSISPSTGSYSGSVQSLAVPNDGQIVNLYTNRKGNLLVSFQFSAAGLSQNLSVNAVFKQNQSSDVFTFQVLNQTGSWITVGSTTGNAGVYKSLNFSLPSAVIVNNVITLRIKTGPGSSSSALDYLALQDSATAAPSPTPSPTPITSPTPTPTPTPSPSPSPSCSSILIPSYFYPYTTDWNLTVSAAPSVSIMIANPNSGPGSSIDSNYASAIAQAQKAGIKVLGYVHTSYGARSISTVESEIDTFYSWYHVDGIFLDEAASSSSLVSYYQTLYNYTHAKTTIGTVVLNPGVYPDQGYMSASDIIMAYEDTAANYTNAQIPSWAMSYPATRFSHVIYGVSGATAMSQVISLSKQRNAGYVFVTDLGLPNPYATVPTYWSYETSGLCQ